MARSGPASVVRRRAARARGVAAERLVCSRLSVRGWRPIAQNWRGGGGELDLVVEREGRLRFVEVKCRSSRAALTAELITPRKRQHLLDAASAFLAAYPDPVEEACFLLALVDRSTIHWLDHAFDA